MAFLKTRPEGMQAFFVIWFGQFVSLLGTGMTRFALTLWAWQISEGSATTLAFMGFFAFTPNILLAPFAGALADRWNRKYVMMLSDFGAGWATIVIFILSLMGILEIWHIYAAAAFTSAFESFQFPAYSAAITTMVSKEQYARTSALLSLAGSVSGIFAPIAAAAFYGILQVQGILLLDIGSFLVALFTLWLVHIPSAKRSEEGVASRGSIWLEAAYGFRFIWARPSMFGLQVAFFFANLLFGMFGTLMSPLILARTGNNEAILAIVNAASGIGGVLGGVFISTWGGFKTRKVRGVFGAFVFCIFGMSLLGIGQSTPVWAIGALLGVLLIPLANASNQAIWQAKVPPDVQGKVFAARMMIASISTPLAMISGGLLADYVFEPAMQADGALVPLFGGLVGTGAGAGLGLMFVIIGVSVAVIGILAYSIPLIRDVESIVPDFDENLVQVQSA